MRRGRVLSVMPVLAVLSVNAPASAVQLADGDYDVLLFAETYHIRCFPLPGAGGDRCVKSAVHTLKWSTVGSDCSVAVDGAAWAGKCGGTPLIAGEVLLHHEGWLMKFYRGNAGDEPLFTTNVVGTGYLGFDFLVLSPKSAGSAPNCP